MTYILRTLLVACTLKMVTSVFFHEPSAIPIKTEERIDFGFSMGFQKGSNMLVVSAPIENNTMHSSHHTIGKVFTCPVSNLHDIKCDQANIDVEALAKYKIDDISPNQNFYLGASIATVQDYFLTCAPLWTSTIKSRRQTSETFSFGTCFTYNGTAHRYLGYPELFVINTVKPSPKVFGGGIGWNTLADEDNDLILITKAFSSNAEGYIFYLNTKKPLDPVLAVTLNENNMQNFGFGMAAGKFFGSDTSYAVSFQEYDMTSNIFFLEKKDRQRKIRLKTKCVVKDGDCRDVIIDNFDVGSMFGYTMTAVDINRDGFTELIVGAPAQRDENPEYGAVHIYVGGSVESMEKTQKTIFGDVEGARFGMTIATSDLDGDNIPEIIVSAPYEDSGKGAVYIISGHKLNKIFFATPIRQVQVSKLEPQKIQRTDGALFGYSLQVIEDLDANGCNELAIGSPGSSTVLLFRSLQAVKVNIKLSTEKQKISDKDNKFDVKVCISLEFNKKATHIEGKILVNNFAYGNGVYLDNPKYEVDLTEVFNNKQTQHCNNVTARFKNSDIGVYTFNTEIEMSGLQKSLEEKDFSKTIAVFNSQSETKQSMEIERRCDGDDCKPKLSMNVTTTLESEYYIGSSKNETLTVTVRNDGFNANGGCVHISVKGAQVRRTKADCKNTGEYYRCRLRNPLRRNSSEIIALELDMVTSVTNLNKSLEMKVELYEDCNNETVPNGSLQISVNYKLNTSVISLTSENHNLDITEESLSEDPAHPAPLLSVDQIYLIDNTGKMKWLDLDAVITFIKTEFKFSIKEIGGIHNCVMNETVSELKCKVDLEPDSITKVILGVELNKTTFGKYIRNVNKTKIESIMSLTLTEDTKSLESRSESIISFKKDTSTQWIVIGIIVALLLFSGLCYILHKYGFFQTQNKKKLARARATVRQRSIRKSTTSQDTQRLHEDGNSPNDMEIVDDNPFDEPSTAASTKDDHKLIEGEVQIHNEAQRCNK